MIDIITRNFFKLMRSGAMNESVHTEPMSAFKWNKLINLAIQQDVVGVTAKAVRNLQYDKSFNMPQTLRERLHTLAGQSKPQQFDISFDSKMLNRKLRTIQNMEMSAPDYSRETLTLFNIIIANCHAMLNEGTSTKLIIKLGNYIRMNIDKIDYPKIDRWLTQVMMKRVAQLVGSILLMNFEFKPEEVPFVKKKDPKAAQMMMKSITQHKIGKHTRGITYFEYAPLENTSILYSQLKGKLDNIEE